MNETSISAPGASLIPDGTGIITTAHLILIAVLAILTIIAIVVGTRRKRTRIDAIRQVDEHAEQAGMIPDEPAPDRQPVVTPAPAPPLADEPIAATTPFAANPAAEATAVSAAISGTSPANGTITQLKGLGPKVATRLAELGITTVGQLAALDDDAATALDAQLGPFAGRMARDRWIEQARLLAAGDIAGFKAVFGNL